MRIQLVCNIIFAWFFCMNSLHPRWRVRGDNEEERRALSQIINSTTTVDASNWDGKDCCEFSGVYCTGFGGRVEEMTLVREPNSSAAAGAWYPNTKLFSVFVELVNLGLRDLGIGGDLQAFCELTKLKNLTILDLSKNLLEGTIPSCFGAMKSLQELDLSSNKLHGNLSPSIFLSQINLYRFDVSNNQLDGLLPFYVFANHSSLSYLDLSNNYQLEVDTESPSWVPKFSLDILGLANCNVNSKRNHVFPSFILNQTELEWLDLSHNSLEGKIPCWLFFSKRVSTLILRGNRFSSSLLSSCSIQNGTSPLAALDISENLITGPIPENIGKLLRNLKHVNMSSNGFVGSIPMSLGDMFLEILDLSNNMFSGQIPRSLTRTGSKLVYLNLSNNRLSGEMIPRVSNMTFLECLQLSGNHLEGIISPAISRSPSLVILDVKNNNLSGNLPRWLYEHPHLVAVLLGGNHFDGHLQKSVCRMQTLQVLDVSDNLLSGGIPRCLDNITFWKKSSASVDETNYFTKNGMLQYQYQRILYGAPDVEMRTNFLTKHILYAFTGSPLLLMTGIDMSLNKLTGKIPPKIGELSQLRSLILSNNLLTGSIPVSFRNLKNVESLDLSHNNLSGEIPREMTELTSLAVFSVAFNNLSGRVPSEKQFSTFDEQDFAGNPLLCGGMLNRTCLSTKSSETEPEEGEGSGGTSSIVDEPLFFYAFVAVSYAFGFWVFFGILIYNKRWRIHYFRAVDRWIFSCFEFLS